MDNFEKVEKLREHANVTHEEAKEALENSRERRQGNIQNPNHCIGIASALRILGSTPIAYHWFIPEYAISFSGTGYACCRSGY